MGNRNNYYRDLGYAFMASALIHLPIIYCFHNSKLEREVLGQERKIVNDKLKDRLRPNLREKNH